MKKVLVMFLVVLFSFSSISYGGTPDPEKWHFVGATGAGDSSYLYIPDLNAGRQLYKKNPYQNNFKVWVLLVFSNGSSDKTQFEYDLSGSKRYRLLGSVKYDEKGNFEKSYDYSRFSEWATITPETIGEFKYDAVAEWIKSK